MKKLTLFGKKLEDALHVIKDNTKTIVIVMNEHEIRYDARHHEIMDREDAQHLKTLEVEHRRVASAEEISCDNIEPLISIGDGFRSINHFF